MAKTEYIKTALAVQAGSNQHGEGKWLGQVKDMAKP